MIHLLFIFHLFGRMERVTASGGEVGRLNTGGGTEVFYFYLTMLCSFTVYVKPNFMVSSISIRRLEGRLLICLHRCIFGVLIKYIFRNYSS